MQIFVQVQTPTVSGTLLFSDVNGVDSSLLPAQEEFEKITLDVSAGNMRKAERTAWRRRALKEPEEP